MTHPDESNPNEPERFAATGEAPDRTPLEHALDRRGELLRDRPGLTDRVFAASVEHLPVPAPIRFAPAQRRAALPVGRLALAASILLVVGLTLVGLLDPFGAFSPGGPDGGELAGGDPVPESAPMTGPSPATDASTQTPDAARPFASLPEAALADVGDVASTSGDTFLVAMLAGDSEIASRVSDTADDGLAARFAPLLTTGFSTFDDVADEIDGILAAADRR